MQELPTNTVLEQFKREDSVPSQYRLARNTGPLPRPNVKYEYSIIPKIYKLKLIRNRKKSYRLIKKCMYNTCSIKKVRHLFLDLTSQLHMYLVMNIINMHLRYNHAIKHKAGMYCTAATLVLVHNIQNHRWSYEEVLGHEVVFTPVDTFLAPSGLYRKCTRDMFIVKYLSTC